MKLLIAVKWNYRSGVGVMEDGEAAVPRFRPIYAFAYIHK